MRDFVLLLCLVSFSCVFAQGNLEQLETDKGFGTVKIGMMVFLEDYETPPAPVVLSRINEFSLLKDKAIWGNVKLDGVSVWAQDLIIDRITMLVGSKGKDTFFQFLVDSYGNPEIIRDMFVWKTPTITLSYRANPQRAAIKKKGQGLCVIWKTSEFQNILDNL